jgi:putative SOS response-associated peptidase YedK
MCGRFTLRTDPAVWAEQLLPGMINHFYFDAARFNIAPTQAIATIYQTSADPSWEMKAMRWGLVPAWADHLSVGMRMINARRETIAEKPAFRKVFRQRRCLIPADGYFEWRAEGTEKQPYYFSFPENQCFAFAGLWEANRKCQTNGSTLQSCTIITTAAMGQVVAYHDRMPVIIEEKHWQHWLDPELQDVESLQQLLETYSQDAIRIFQVSRYVNNVRNQGSQCVQPLE